MGADLLLASCSMPQDTNGYVWDQNSATPVLVERIYKLDSNALDRIAGLMEDCGLLNEDDEDDAEVYTSVQDYLKKAVPVLWVAENTTWLHVRGWTVLITGGMSWGDTPSDCWDEICIIAASEITETPVTREEVEKFA